jgi:hypothetical protein
VPHPIVEGLDDLLLEAARTRVSVDDGPALLVRELVIGDAHYVHLDAGRNKGDDRMHVRRDAGGRVQRFLLAHDSLYESSRISAPLDQVACVDERHESAETNERPEPNPRIQDDEAGVAEDRDFRPAIVLVSHQPHGEHCAACGDELER